MRELHLTVGIFLAFDIDFHFVADLEVAVVAEFGSVDDAVGLEADVEDHFAVVDGDHLAGDDVTLLDGLEGLGIGFLEACLLVFGVAVVLVGDLVPAEVFERVGVGVLDLAHFAGTLGGFGSLFGFGHGLFGSGGGFLNHAFRHGFGNIFHVLRDFFDLFRSVQ